MALLDGSLMPLVIEVNVAAAEAAVWASLREPDLIKLWYGWHYDDLDAEIDVIFIRGGIADDDRHTLQLSGGDRFEVLPGEEEGTVVRIVRPPNVAGAEGSEYYAEVTEGWVSFLQQLRYLHEVHPGESRRTVFLSGTGGADALPSLLASLPTAVGRQYYSAPHQSGFELPDLGPGLLITGSTAADGDPEAEPVSAMAIVTTYGLDEADFGRQSQSWAAWWRTAYPDSDDPQT